MATNSDPASTDSAGRDEVLVAEHDQAVAELIRRYLAKDGLSVRTVGSAAETTGALTDCRAAVVVLDLTMPGLDAREIRRMIRPRPGPATSQASQATSQASQATSQASQATSQASQATSRAARRARSRPAVRGPAADVPVICLIAGEGSHPAQGLRARDVGVDPDTCLGRPFGPRVLVDRVRAAARHVQPRPVPPSYAAGRLSVHPGRRRATLDGAEIALTGTEFDVLSCLVRSAGRTVPRAALRAAVWGEDGQADAQVRAAPGDRIVDVYIAQLRTKIGPIHGIRTVRGIGYVLDATAPGGTLNPGGRSSAPEPPATIGDAGHPSRGDSGIA